MASTALSAARSALASRSQALAKFKSPATAAMNGALVVAGSGVGGVLDGKIGEIAGVRASTGTGIAAVAAGLALKSPKAIMFGSGLLAPAAYDAGLAWGQGIEIPGVG